MHTLSKIAIVDNSSPSILVRSRKTPSVCTGLRVVDVLFPVAFGQRELIIGDRQSGKSTVWLCSTISQVVRNSSVVSFRKLFSVVSFVGSRCSTAIRFLRMVERCDSRNSTIFLISPVTDAMGAQYTAHLTATALGEIFRNSGSILQAMYDDLSKHAVAYRQLCLFLRKPAGREAYPSDVFYLHARLLERSCNLGGTGNFGSLMSLPVIETLNNDLSAYIATNVISITDGQIYLDLTLFGLGQCPAISTEKSVSRVGAKSLDEISRASAFSLYRLIGSVKQEADNATKSEGFALRNSRYRKFYAWLVQRSSQAKLISTAGNFAIHSGMLDLIPISCIPIFLILSAEFSSSSFCGNGSFLSDRVWSRENLAVLDSCGNAHPYVGNFVTGLRLVISATFSLSTILSSISASAASVAAGLLLTLASATSFLVDIRDQNSKDSEKLFWQSRNGLFGAGRQYSQKLTIASMKVSPKRFTFRQEGRDSFSKNPPFEPIFSLGVCWKVAGSQLFRKVVHHTRGQGTLTAGLLWIGLLVGTQGSKICSAADFNFWPSEVEMLHGRFWVFLRSFARG